MSKKQKKIFKIIIIVLVIFLIAETIYFGIRYYNYRKDNVFYTVVNSAIFTDDGYISVGFSDYKYSDFNEFDRGYQKPTIFVNKNGKLVKEISVNLGYNGFFNDIVKTKDGYVAVGAIAMDEEQNKDKLSEGLIVKYDENFKEVWRKNVNIIGKTEFLKVKLDKKENIIIAGTSVYGSGYVGNHATGGGILLKYSNEGKELLRVNNGGPYNGRFNDVVLEDDGYVVAGLGRANSGIIIKYNLKGKKMWTGSYGYTDEKGITAVEKLGNKYIASTTKVVDKEDLSSYQAAIVVFDSKGEKLDDTKYSSDKVTSFTDIEISDDMIVACGYTGKKINDVIKSDAIIVKYDKDLYEESSDILKGENNDFYNDINIKDDNIYILGYSNSKIKEFKDLNGYDYFEIWKKYDKTLK